MRICFDLDGTLCSNTNGKYTEAIPYQYMIDLVNELYDAGHIIIISTARGMSDPNMATTNYYSLTQDQLDNQWGIKYHELHLCKIEADIYIDDKGYQSKDDGTGAEDLRKFLETEHCKN